MSKELKQIFDTILSNTKAINDLQQWRNEVDSAIGKIVDSQERIVGLIEELNKDIEELTKTE